MEKAGWERRPRPERREHVQGSSGRLMWWKQGRKGWQDRWEMKSSRPHLLCLGGPTTVWIYLEDVGEPV